MESAGHRGAGVENGLAGPNGAAGIYGRSVAGAALRWFAMGRSGGRAGAAHGGAPRQRVDNGAAADALCGELAAGVWPGALDDTRVWFAPLVNPDGVSLVTGQLASGALYENARRIAEQFPAVPFPGGWKANIRGVDLNLQYPAGWEEAKEIKYAAGWDRPAPRDYVGSAPLCAPREPRALPAHEARLARPRRRAAHPGPGHLLALPGP